MVRLVVEFRDICQLNNIKRPYNAGIPRLELLSLLLSTPSYLELFRGHYTMLPIDNHEFSRLDVIPLVWGTLQQFIILIDGDQIQLLPLSFCIPKFHKFLLDNVDHVLLQLPHNICVLCKNALLNRDIERLAIEKKTLLMVIPELFLVLGEFFVIFLYLGGPSILIQNSRLFEVSWQG